MRREAQARIEETAEATVERFRAGDLTVLDTLITESDLTNARLEVLAAERTYLSLAARLRFATGTLLDLPAAGDVRGGAGDLQAIAHPQRRRLRLEDVALGTLAHQQDARRRHRRRQRRQRGDEEIEALDGDQATEPPDHERLLRQTEGLARDAPDFSGFAADLSAAGLADSVFDDSVLASAFAGSAMASDLPSSLSAPCRLRLFSLSDLKSVSYQPEPLRRKSGADMSLRKEFLPQLGHFFSGLSVIFCSTSSR